MIEGGRKWNSGWLWLQNRVQDHAFLGLFSRSPGASAGKYLSGSHNLYVFKKKVNYNKILMIVFPVYAFLVFMS